MADPNDQMGGAGTPRGGGPAVPRVDTQNLDVALATMARIAEQTEASTKATVELVRHLERVSRTSKEVENNLGGWGTEFTTVMRNSANLEYTIKRIQKLQAQRVGGGASRSGTADYIQQLQKEYKILLQVLNTGKGQGRYVKEVDAALKGLDSTLKRVRRSNEATWDADAIQEVNRTLQETAQRVGDVQRAMSKVQVQKMTQGFHEMRETMDEAFGGQFSQMLRRIPGVAKIMQATRFRRQAGAAQEGLKTLSSQRMEMRQEAWKGAAREAVKTHGPGAMQHLRTLGYTGGRPVGNKLMSVGPLTARGRRTIGGVSAGVSQVGGSTVARAGGSLEQMSVKTMVVQQMVQGKNAAKELARADAKAGRRARFNPKTGELVGQQAETPAARTGAKRPSAKSIIRGLRRKVEGPAPDVDSVASTVAGKGGTALSRGFNNMVIGMAKSGGWKGKAARALLSRGAGSATAAVGQGAVGMGSGLLSGGMKLASRAAVPLAVVSSLISAQGKIAEDNKRVQDALGGAGIHGQGAGGVDFRSIKKSLLSTGLAKAMLLGQGQAENQQLMSTIAEHGYAVGGTLRRGVNLGEALDQRSGLTGNGFYGSVMKNALYNGKNLGMNQDQSVRLTLKLVEKFGKTMEATQEFFVGMDDMMQSSGITASKYIEIIDDITDQFGDMNRSLTHTVTLLNNVGKGGRFTGDALAEMAKNLTKPNQMSFAQRAYNAKTMIASGDHERAASAIESGANADMQALRSDLNTRKIPLTTEQLADIAGNKDAILLAMEQALKDKPEELKTLRASFDATLDRYAGEMAKVSALRSGDIVRIAATVANAGEGSTEAMFAKQATLRNLAKLSGMGPAATNDLLANDSAAVQQFLQSKTVQAAFESGGVFQGMTPEDVRKMISASGQARSSGAATAVGWGQGAEDVATLTAQPNGGARYASLLRLQQERVRLGSVSGVGPDGKTKSADQLVKEFLAEAKEGGGAKLVKALARLDETLAQVTTSGTAMAQALKAQTDAAAREQARAKATRILEETRPVAEIFAKSFEYLFDQLLAVLSKTARIMNPAAWFAKQDATDPHRWIKGRESTMQSVMAGMDMSKSSDKDREAVELIKTRIDQGYYRAGDSKQQDQRLKEAYATLTRIGGPSATARLTQGYAQEAATAATGKNLIDPNSPAAGYLGAADSMDAAVKKRAEQYPQRPWQDHVDHVGKMLLQHVRPETAEDDFLGVLRGMGRSQDMRLVEDPSGGTASLVTKTDTATNVADSINRLAGMNLLGAGERRSDGTVVYNISMNPHYMTHKVPRGVGQDGKPAAAQVEQK